MPLKNLILRKKYSKHYRKENHKILCEAKRSYWKRQRLIVLLHYSNGRLRCRCCGEKTYEFMSLDHIHGNGNKQRRKIKSNYLLNWIIKQGFPKGYQVLCHNCNLAKGFYGRCPHFHKKCRHYNKQRKLKLVQKQFENQIDQ